MIRSWNDQYISLVPRLGEFARELPLTLCGLATCTDAYLRLAEADALFPPGQGMAAVLATLLQERVAAGIGGELFLDWPEAEPWIAENLQVTNWGLGGTGAQAAQALALFGAPTLISLEDRSRRQLSVIHPHVLIATKNGLKPRSALIESGPSKPAHYIFEFNAGEQIGTVRAKRSTRVIVRFADDRLDRDTDFVRESTARAHQAGAAVICGFNEVAEPALSAELEYAKALLSNWRANGLSLIHLELGGYEKASLRQQVLSPLAPLVDSLGMSHSELREFGSGHAATEAAKLRTRLGLQRICVHADTWALALTRNPAEAELEALMCGCLLASCRAANGKPSIPIAVPDGAEFQEPPYPPISKFDDVSLVCCPAPYLQRPKATIGLGDTFLAGNLLRLGIL
jgi:ADP-dependent phosphofructokinase/glucokinase